MKPTLPQCVKIAPVENTATRRVQNLSVVVKIALLVRYRQVRVLLYATNAALVIFRPQQEKQLAKYAQLGGNNQEQERTLASNAKLVFIKTKNRKHFARIVCLDIIRL